ncbi:unnamed protein product, partial [Heterotrigona itama]
YVSLDTPLHRHKHSAGASTSVQRTQQCIALVTSKEHLRFSPFLKSNTAKKMTKMFVFDFSLQNQRQTNNRQGDYAFSFTETSVNNRFNNFYPVMSYRRVQEESDYCIRFGHSLWSANQLPTQG